MALELTTAPESVQLAKNPVYVRFLSTDHALLDNYRVVLQVLFEAEYGEGTYPQIVEVEAIPDSGGVTAFDLSGILQPAIENSAVLQVPDVADPLPYACDTLRRFNIRYFEKYGTPQEEQPATTSGPYKVLYGGVDAHYFGLYDFFDNLASGNSLLTYWPSGKTVARDQPEYLTHIRHQSIVGYYAFLRVRQYGSNGALIGQFDKYRLTGSFDSLLFLDRYQAGVFPTGPAALGVDASAVKYTVQVYAVGTVEVFGEGLVESGTAMAASQVYAYYIDDAQQPFRHDIIWFGGFRNPHVLRCTGRRRTSLSVDRLLSGQVVPFGYDPASTGEVQHRRSFGQPYGYRTGPLRPEEADALQEMLIEDTLLEYTGDGNYYRLLLTGNSFDIHEEGVSPNALGFTAVRALAARNYMRLRSIEDGAPAMQDWQANDNGFWELNSGGFWQLN